MIAVPANKYLDSMSRYVSIADQATLHLKVSEHFVLYANCYARRRREEKLRAASIFGTCNYQCITTRYSIVRKLLFPVGLLQLKVTFRVKIVLIYDFPKKLQGTVHSKVYSDWLWHCYLLLHACIYIPRKTFPALVLHVYFYPPFHIAHRSLASWTQ